MEAPTTIKKPIRFFFRDTNLSPLEIIERDFEHRTKEMWLDGVLNGSEEFEITRRQEKLEVKHKDLIRGLQRGYYLIKNRTLYELSYGE